MLCPWALQAKQIVHYEQHTILFYLFSDSESQDPHQRQLKSFAQPDSLTCWL